MKKVVIVISLCTFGLSMTTFAQQNEVKKGAPSGKEVVSTTEEKDGEVGEETQKVNIAKSVEAKTIIKTVPTESEESQVEKARKSIVSQRVKKIGKKKKVAPHPTDKNTPIKSKEQEKIPSSQKSE